MTEEEPAPVPEHEELLNILNTFDVLQLKQGLSLDTTQNSVRVQGPTYEKHIENIKSILEVVARQHTVTRDSVRSKRIPFPGSSYFLTLDGYIIDRRDAVVEVLVAFRDFALEYKRQSDLESKSSVVVHNLKLTGYIVTDMLSFVKALHVKERTVPGDQDRDVERSPSGTVETRTV